jgi:UDP-3-O-[3-hydroxymyristoyl] glucosamine N-acyltransferase
MKRDIPPLSAREVADRLKLELDGDDATVSGVAPFPPDEAAVLCFAGRLPDGPLSPLPTGCVVIATEAGRQRLRNAGATVIVSGNPKYDFCRLFDLIGDRRQAEIHPTAHIGPDVVIADGVSVGPGCVLDGTIRIGEGTRIGAHVVLRNQVTIGRDVSIRNGAVIGENAFSFGFSDDDHAKADAIRFPCFGGVVIEDRVEIGNNCVISRGTFRDTVLGERARINDLAHLGNEVRVGARSTVTAHCDISARVNIGTGCWIGQSAAIRQGLTIGDGATVGMGAVVTGDVAAHTVVMGVPARFKRDA